MKKLYLKPISGIFMVKRKSDEAYFLMLRVLDTTLNITRIIKSLMKANCVDPDNVFISVRNSAEKFTIDYDIVSTAAIQDNDIFDAVEPFLYDDYKFKIITDKNWFQLVKE